MMRSTFLRFGLAAALLAAVPAAYFGVNGVSAQGFPPDPPLVVYGTASGAQTGAGVHSIGVDGNRGTWCGTGRVVEGSNYVVQVVADNQTDGCGQSGRNIRLYVTPFGSGGQFNGQGGRFSSSFTWQSSIDAPVEEDVTLGDTLQVRGFVPGVTACQAYSSEAACQ